MTARDAWTVFVCVAKLGVLAALAVLIVASLFVRDEECTTVQGDRVCQSDYSPGY